MKQPPKKGDRSLPKSPPPSLPRPLQTFLALALVALLPQIGSAQGPVLIKDLNPTPLPNLGSGPGPFVDLGSVTIFPASTTQTGYELFQTDGTAKNTVLIKDLLEGAKSSSPRFLTRLKNKIFFSAYDPKLGRELWVTDGTAQGTKLFQDIYPGISDSNPKGFTLAGNQLFFVATNKKEGTELWVTDGTRRRTYLVRDIEPGFVGSKIRWLTAFGSKVIFQAYRDGDLEPWISDGTPRGTYLLKNIHPQGNSNAGLFTALGNKVIFAANDPLHGNELWITDGTTKGTVLLKDLVKGKEDSFPEGFSQLGNHLLFTATDPIHGRELWITDGTSNGTKLVKDILPGKKGSKPEEITAFGAKAVFRVSNRFDPRLQRKYYDLWITDGTPAGTTLVKKSQGGNVFFFPTGFTVLSPKMMVFNAADPTHGRELWGTDGTTQGTKMIKDIYPGVEWGYSNLFHATQGKAFFNAEDGVIGFELWITDGSPGGTHLVKDIENLYGKTHSSNPSELSDHFNRTFFAASDKGKGGGTELWITDGTSSGTTQVKDINPGPYASQPSNFVHVGNKTFFQANDGKNGKELWVTDGTKGGTHLVKNIGPGGRGGRIWDYTPFGDLLIFMADDGKTGGELWRSDGTAAGTFRIKDIFPGYMSGLHGAIGDFVVFKGKVYFQANDGIHGGELWVTDGTTQGTKLFKDLAPGIASSNPDRMLPKGDRMFFRAGNGNGPWVTDGTPAGTKRFKLIGKENLTGDGKFIPTAGGKLFFTGNTPNTGNELWVSDGTPQGTHLVKDILPGSKSSLLSFLGPLGDKVLFEADDGVHGREPWVSDGTPKGTILLKDIAPGRTNSNPFSYLASYLASGSRFGFFTAQNASTGRELWKTDGTPSGTSMVPEVFLGPQSSDPRDLVLSNGNILFSAVHPTLGREPFRYFPQANTKMVGRPCGTPFTGLPYLRGSDPILGKRMNLYGSQAKPGSVGFPLVGVPVKGVAIPLRPFGSGCLGFSNPSRFWMQLSILGVPPSGNWSRSFIVPNQRSLIGVQVAFQVWYATIPSLLWNASNGVFATLGT